VTHLQVDHLHCPDDVCKECIDNDKANITSFYFQGEDLLLVQRSLAPPLALELKCCHRVSHSLCLSIGPAHVPIHAPGPKSTNASHNLLATTRLFVWFGSTKLAFALENPVQIRLASLGSTLHMSNKLGWRQEIATESKCSDALAHNCVVSVSLLLATDVIDLILNVVESIAMTRRSDADQTLALALFANAEICTPPKQICVETTT